MSWLIALALFWGVGSWIAKLIDEVNSSKIGRRFEQDKQHELFLRRLYVAAWPYYQDLEKEALQKWEENGFECNPFRHLDLFEPFQVTVFGEPIHQRAIRLAFSDLQTAGYPVYRSNPYRSRDPRIGEWFAPVSPVLEVDFVDLYNIVYEYRTTIPMIRLDHFYYYPGAQKIESESLSKLIPPITDPRVGYYKFNGREYERDGFPYDYKDRIKLYEDEQRLKKLQSQSQIEQPKD